MTITQAVPWWLLDGVDRQHRHYRQVEALTDRRLRIIAEASPALECVECSGLIAHGFERYFQRTDPPDGAPPDTLEVALRGLMFDPVCGSCGDRLLREGSQ